MPFSRKKKPIIEFKNVCFGYKPNKPIVKNLSFSINENDYLTIVGPNGSGKSTLGKILMGLLKPNSGFIYINGQKLTPENITNYKRNVSAVFENPDNQFVLQTVEDEIAFNLENLQVPRIEMIDRIEAIANKLGIKKLLKSNPSLLSGGQKQKVAIASCLATHCDIIVFDEASNMLDPQEKQELIEIMFLLKNKFNKTIISITHDMQEVLLSDKTLLLVEGKIIKKTTPFELFKKDSLIESYGLKTPLEVKLAKAFRLKPQTNLNKLVQEIVHEK